MKNHTLNVLITLDTLHELPFYYEINIVKRSKAFKGYERSYKIEILNPKDPSV